MGSCRSKWFFAAAVAGATSAVLAASGLSATKCEDPEPEPGSGAWYPGITGGRHSRNQLASGISNAVVNTYVDQILANDMINIRSLPDSVERLIYATTVRVTLNAVYHCLSLLHGTNSETSHLQGHYLVSIMGVLTLRNVSLNPKPRH